MAGLARSAVALLSTSLVLSVAPARGDDASETKGEGAPAASANVEAAKEEEAPPKIRGPAEDLVLEGSFGYGVGALSAIAGHDPNVLHGPTFHLGAGWAWSIKTNQSLGLELFADGMFDGERTTGSTTKLGARYGAAAFVVGERAHLRIGAAYARTTMARNDYAGIAVTFAAGWHVPILPGAKSWKRPYLTFDAAPSWDFLGAGSETLHRWGFSLMLGIAVY